MIPGIKYFLDSTNIINRQSQKYHNSALFSIIDFTFNNLEKFSIVKYLLEDGHLQKYILYYIDHENKEYITITLGEYESHIITHETPNLKWTQEISLIKHYNFKIVEVLDMLKNHITNRNLA